MSTMSSKSSIVVGIAHLRVLLHVLVSAAPAAGAVIREVVTIIIVEVTLRDTPASAPGHPRRCTLGPHGTLLTPSPPLPYLSRVVSLERVQQVAAPVPPLRPAVRPPRSRPSRLRMAKHHHRTVTYCKR
jgi:hypothetical protein